MTLHELTPTRMLKLRGSTSGQRTLFAAIGFVILLFLTQSSILSPHEQVEPDQPLIPLEARSVSGQVKDSDKINVLGKGKHLGKVDSLVKAELSNKEKIHNDFGKMDNVPGKMDNISKVNDFGKINNFSKANNFGKINNKANDFGKMNGKGNDLGNGKATNLDRVTPLDKWNDLKEMKRNEKEKTKGSGNEEDQERFLWPDDPECSRHSVVLGEHLPLKYLVSYPRSGNTWVRYLVEGASGIYTGSVYSDSRLSKVYRGETLSPNSGRVILVKSHYKALAEKSDLADPERTLAVFLIRRPDKCIMSHFDFFCVERTHGRKKAFTGHCDSDVFKTPKFHDFVKTKLKLWELVIKDGLSEVKNVLVVFYENIVKAPIPEVRRILRFLEVPADESRLLCLEKHIEGMAKRNHSELNPYSEEEKKLFAASIAKISKLLEARNFSVPSEYTKAYATSPFPGKM